jgi:hypothetical protein
MAASDLYAAPLMIEIGGGLQMGKPSDRFFVPQARMP